MKDIELFLKKVLKKKLAIIGVGSELRGDDGIGPYLSEKLSQFNGENFLSINGDLVPENFTQDLRMFKPEEVILIDAAFMEKSPGEIDIIEVNKLSGVSFSSHSMPLSVLGRYLSKEIGASIHILGIQAANVDFGNDISPKIKDAADRIFEIIKKEMD